MEYVHFIPDEDIGMQQLKADLHTWIGDQRIAGEWFNLSDEDIAYIKSLEVES